MQGQLMEAVDARMDEFVEMLSSFIAVPTENPPGTNLAEDQEWLGNQLSYHGIDFAIHRTARGETDDAIVIGDMGTGDPFLYFHGHYDVVLNVERNTRWERTTDM